MAKNAETSWDTDDELGLNADDADGDAGAILGSADDDAGPVPEPEDEEPPAPAAEPETVSGAGETFDVRDLVVAGDDDDDADTEPTDDVGDGEAPDQTEEEDTETPPADLSAEASAQAEDAADEPEGSDNPEDPEAEAQYWYEEAKRNEERLHLLEQQLAPSHAPTGSPGQEPASPDQVGTPATASAYGGGGTAGPVTPPTAEQLAERFATDPTDPIVHYAAEQARQSAALQQGLQTLEERLGPITQDLEAREYERQVQASFGQFLADPSLVPEASRQHVQALYPRLRQICDAGRSSNWQDALSILLVEHQQSQARQQAPAKAREEGYRQGRTELTHRQRKGRQAAVASGRPNRRQQQASQLRRQVPQTLEEAQQQAIAQLHGR